jgi:L-iditol 2-dehydrogenase
MTVLTNGSAVKATKANIGVFTNPGHDLWISDAKPALETVQAGGDLKEGQVTVAIRSTGICGYLARSSRRRVCAD